MATTPARIIIRHVSGSKANRIEQFPLDAFPELTIGRNPQSTIQFDAVNDDEVSRRHALIKIALGDPPTFKLSDQNSANGTLKNGKAVSGETELLPGDEIELGVGGPKFVFDMDPRPPGMVGSTRLLSSEQGRTRVLGATGTGPTAAGKSDGTSGSSFDTGTVGPAPFGASPRGGTFGGPSSRPSVGRTTVMGWLAAERQSVARKAIYGIAGLLFVILAVGGTLYYIHQKSAQEQAVALAKANADREAEVQRLQAEAAKAKKDQEEKDKRFAEQQKKTQAEIGWTAEKIAATYSDATVKILIKWRLFDKTSSKPIFHKAIKVDGKLRPLYVLLPNQQLVRWLTLEDDQGQNQPIGGEGTGSGFVVKSDGFILTNKHVAAGWAMPYEFGNYEGSNGIVVQAIMNRPQTAAERKKALADLGNTITGFDQTRAGRFSTQLHDWIPEDTAIVFDDNLPIPLETEGRPLVGRSEQLDVLFPGDNPSQFHADLVKQSATADTALIKIAAPASLHFVELAAPDDKVSPGEHIVVLGYPGLAAREYRITETLGGIGGGGSGTVKEEIAKTTVTDGVIANVGSPLRTEGTTTTGSVVGYAYQLSDLATGAGNSGGPVFNSKGKVIGIFSFARERGSERATYAWPIAYASALLQIH